MSWFSDLIHSIFVEHYFTTVWVIAFIILLLIRKYASALADKSKSILKKYSFVIFLNVLSGLLLFGYSLNIISTGAWTFATYIIVFTFILDFIIVFITYVKNKRSRKNA